VQSNFTVIDIIKQRKLQLFGHICRMPDNRLIKAIMLGMVDGDRHRGRPPRRWVDDVVDWCGRPLPEVRKLRMYGWRTEKSGEGSQEPWINKKKEKVENHRWINCTPVFGPQQVVVGLQRFYEIWGLGTLDLNNWKCKNCVPLHSMAL